MSPDAAPQKICSKCKAKNSPQKNYCDLCGTPLSQPAPEAPGPREIPLTVRVDKKPQAQPSFNLPLAGRAEPALAAPAPAPITSTKTSKKKTTSSASPHPSSSVAIPWFPALLALLAAGGAWQYHAYNKPERAAVRAADEYFGDLLRQDYPRAYDLLSTQARANCDIGRFQESLPPPLPSWPGLTLSHMEGDTALLRYSGGSLFMVLDDGRWSVPYANHFTAKAADAVAHHDPDIAVLQAQAAVSINPRDPASRGLLCEAYLEHHMAQEAQKECAVAVDLSGKFGLAGANIEKWRRIAASR